MNEIERKALVDELAEAMAPIIRMVVDDYNTDPKHSEVMYLAVTEELATACLPIIDRLLAAAAAPGLDDLLPYDWNFEVRYEGEGMSTLPWLRPEPTEDEIYYAQVGPWDAHASGYFEGAGPTRTEALKAAAALKEGHNDD